MGVRAIVMIAAGGPRGLNEDPAIGAGEGLRSVPGTRTAAGDAR